MEELSRRPNALASKMPHTLRSASDECTRHLAIVFPMLPRWFSAGGCSVAPRPTTQASSTRIHDETAHNGLYAVGGLLVHTMRCCSFEQ